jgi:hypothetical protein
MLKADQAHSTIASGLNRRGILSGGCPATLPRPASRTSPFSPEFQAWYVLAKSLPQVLAEDDAWIASQYGCGVLDPKDSPHLKLCEEMRPFETYLCMRSTTEPASIIAAIELAMVALWWTEGAGGGTIDDPFAVDPFALKYDPNLDEGDRGERASAHLVQLVARLFLEGGARG